MPPIGPAVSQAVRSASRGERDVSVRVVGTAVALGIILAASYAFTSAAEKPRSPRRR